MKDSTPRRAEPNREVIYADLDDEVTTLFERVKKAHSKNVVLVAPANAAILQSLVGLKILRFKSEAASKTLTIVTKDPVGRKLAATAGFTTAVSARVHGKRVEVFREQQNSTAVEPTHQHRITRRRLSIVESTTAARAALQRLSRDEIPLAKINPVPRVQSLWKKVSGAPSTAEIAESESATVSLIVRPPNRKLLVGLVAAATLLLFFIIYIAVPTATIYVVPRADPLTKVVNVTLSDRVASSGPRGVGESTHTISAEFFDFTFSQDIRIGATGQIFTGTNAYGTITIFNRSPRDKFIVPSRFLSADGFIFRTQKALTIPREIGGVPGSIVAEVEACETDDQKCDCVNAEGECGGDFVGERGNIAPSFFTLPAIPSLSPALYWAESEQPMSGGATKIEKFISEEDIVNVQETVAREIIALAKAELTQLLGQKNQLENRNLVLLDDRQTIAVEIIDLTIPPNLVGNSQNDFAVAVTARVRGVAYEDDDLRTLLFEQLETKVHPDKALTKVKFNNMVYHVERVNLSRGQVKLAVTIEGVEEYDISAETVAGTRLIEKIRGRILGRDAREAEAYIHNLPEVNSAVISSWPFWAHTIPDLPENVKFKVQR